MNKTLLNLAVIASLGLSTQAFAQEAHSGPNEAIVGDSAGDCVIDGSGEKVRTSAWTQEKGDEACAPPAAVVAEEPAPVPTPVSETMTLSAAALFEFDSAKFVRDQPQLNEFADRVKGLTTVESVNVVGHTDSVGTDAYNQGLSERRAEAVKTYLVDRGVDANLISVSGMGESQPVADNATADGREQNRRVEITFKGSETLK